MPGVPECTGACCAAFPLSTLTHAQATASFFGTIADGATLYAMIRPLSLDEAADRVERFGLTMAVQDYPEHLFACNRWDERTKRCMAYDVRPQMCYEYPYGQTCSHCGGKLEEDAHGDDRPDRVGAEPAG